MKNINIILTFVLTFLMISCTNVLDYEPVNRVTPDEYYRTEKQIKSALTGVYSTFGNRAVYGGLFPVFQHVMSDDVYSIGSGAAVIQVYTFKVLPTHGNINQNRTSNGLWFSLYQGILRANTLLAKIDQAQFVDEQNREQMRAEARFLRALAYFILVDNWHRVPLLTEENYTSTTEVRQDAEVVWAYIESELEAVVKGTEIKGERYFLPLKYDGSDGKERGRVTLGAARSLLGKALMYQQKYSEAVPYLKAVIDSDVYALGDVMNIFQNDANLGEEKIFEVLFGETDGKYPWFDDLNLEAAEISLRNVYLASIQVSGYENANPTPEFIELFKAGDKRYDSFIFKDGDILRDNLGKEVPFDGVNGRQPYLIRKGLNSGFSVNSPISPMAEENYPVIRYADVLLLYAEALAQSGGSSSAAIDAVDQVRARAFELSVQDLRQAGEGIEDVMTDEGLSLLQAIKRERRIELCFEGHRYSDLRRWGELPQNQVLIDRGWSEDSKYFPAPFTETNLTPGF